MNKFINYIFLCLTVFSCYASEPLAFKTVDVNSAQGKVFLVWETDDEAHDSFEIREIVNNEPKEWERIDQSTLGSKLFENRLSGSYQYQVRSCEQNICEHYINTNVIEIKRIPLQPSWVEVKDLDDALGNYTLTWQEDEVAEYYLVRKLNVSSIWVNHTETAADSFTFFDKKPGTYTYAVKACSEFGCSEQKELSGNVVISRSPSPVEEFYISSLDEQAGEFNLAWTPVDEATEYKILHLNENGDWQEENTTTLTQLSFLDKAPGLYQYAVEACTEYNCSEKLLLSEHIGITRTPNVPREFKVQDVDEMHGNYTLTWEAVDHAYRYEVLTHGEDSFDFTTIVGVINGTSFSFGDQPTNDYEYAVRACTQYACSDYITLTEAIHIKRVLPLPEQLTISEYDKNYGTFALSWLQVEGSTFYRIVKDNPRLGWIAVARVDGTSIKFEDKLTGTYHYGVKACNKLYCSDVVPFSDIEIKRVPIINAWKYTDVAIGVGEYTIQIEPPSFATWKKVRTVKVSEFSSETGEWSEYTSHADRLNINFYDKDNGTYKYRIQVCNYNGCSEPVETTDLVIKRVPRSNLYLINVDTDLGNFTVRWSCDRFATECRFDELHSGSSQESFVSEEYAFSDLPNGTYSYRLHACGIYGCREKKEVSVTVFRLPARPTVTVVNNEDEVSLNWVSNDERTEFYRVTDKGSQTVYENENNLKLDLTNKTPGLYEYEVQVI